MTEIFAGIVTLWDGASLDSTIAGGIHFGEAPIRTAFPYCVMNQVSSVPRGFTSSGKIESKLIRLDVWYRAVAATDPVAGIGALMTAINDVMENADPSVSGADAIQMRLVADRVLREDRSIYHGVLDYEVLLKKDQACA